jgi:hypothetical protein
MRGSRCQAAAPFFECISYYLLGCTIGAFSTRQHADQLNVRLNHGRLEICQNFFSVRTGARWNEVPPEIKHARTAAAFKRLYSAHRHAMI